RMLEILVASEDGNGNLARLMRALRFDIQSRLAPPNVKPWTAQLDDQWIFDERYLLPLSNELGMAKVEVYPAQQDLSSVYECAFRSVLADSGNAALPIPDPVLDAVRDFDRAICPGMNGSRCLS